MGNLFCSYRVEQKDAGNQLLAQPTFLEREEEQLGMLWTTP